MAGGAADCQFWYRNLGIKYCSLHELAIKRKISVAGASKKLANIHYSYQGMYLSVGTMIAGWDEQGHGLYYLDSTEGGRLKGTRFSVGSGSPYAYERRFYSFDFIRFALRVVVETLISTYLNS